MTAVGVVLLIRAQFDGKPRQVTVRVDKRLRRILNEKTGQILELKNPCVVLEGSTCKGNYTRPLLCPRGMQPYWREIWLERGESAQAACSTELSAPIGS